MSETRIFRHAAPALTPRAQSEGAPVGTPAPATGDGMPLNFPAGTRLRTPDGPRAVETLAEGERVSTEAGALVLRRVARRVVPREDWTFARALWPVRVPVGSLGNPHPLRLVGTQRIVLGGEVLRERLGTPEAEVEIGDLIGLCGILHERPVAALRLHGIAFGAPARVEAEGVTCLLDTAPPREAPDRETLRAAVQAMHAAGQPPLAAGWD